MMTRTSRHPVASRKKRKTHHSYDSIFTFKNWSIKNRKKFTDQAIPTVSLPHSTSLPLNLKEKRRKHHARCRGEAQMSI